MLNICRRVISLVQLRLSPSNYLVDLSHFFIQSCFFRSKNNTSYLLLTNSLAHMDHVWLIRREITLLTISLDNTYFDQYVYFSAPIHVYYKLAVPSFKFCCRTNLLNLLFQFIIVYLQHMYP